MSGVRELRADDLASVATLYEQVWRSGTREPPPGLAEYFGRTLLEHPWADPDIPSLVYESPDGEIVGFLGASPRRLRLDGERVRLACSSNLVVHEDWRPRGAGALLMRRFLTGPQDVSITDGANDDSRRLWTGLRGDTLVHASVGWLRVFRPATTVDAGLEVLRRGGVRRRVVHAVAAPLDAVTRAVPGARERLTPVEPASHAEELTNERLLEQMEAARWWRLQPEYDAEYLGWLVRELEAVAERGRLVRHLVRGANGRVLGWYLFLLPPGGIAQVLQIAVPGPDPSPVVDHLLWHAHREGAAAVHGRLEPVTAGLLGTPGVLLRKTSWALAHTGNPTLLGLLGTPRSLVSRLEGEWWMGHGSLWRTGDRERVTPQPR